MPVSPTQRTLQRLRAQGYFAEVVEHRHSFAPAHVTVDFLGIIDVIALRPGATLGVQATSMKDNISNVNARMRKAEAEPRLVHWLAAGNAFEVWGWSENALVRWRALIVSGVVTWVRMEDER